MTEQAAVVTPVWVIDAMCLIHFGRADRLDVLRGLLVDKECWTTQVVLEELSQGAASRPALMEVAISDWLKIARLDTLDEIRLFAQWANRLGSGERDLGEASVFAAAELRSATAITDDQAAVRVARTYGLDVHGTIWLLAGTCRDGKLPESTAGTWSMRYGLQDSGFLARERSSRPTHASTGSCEVSSRDTTPVRLGFVPAQGRSSWGWSVR
jgi:predicted nucleic acid-binding protein